MRFSVTMVRPYDLSTRQKVSHAVEQAGGKVVRIFEDPVDLSLVGAWLQHEGNSTTLVVPFNVRAGENGIDILVELFLLLPTPRRVLMPIKVASATAVAQMLEKTLGANARYILPLSLESLGSAEGIQSIREFLAAP